MKKLIMTLIILSFVGVCIAASVQDAIRAVIARKNTITGSVYLTDDFYDNSFDTAKWTEGTNPVSLVEEQNNRLEIISDGARVALIRSDVLRSMQNTKVIIKVTQLSTDWGLRILPTSAISGEYGTSGEPNMYKFDMVASYILSPNVIDGGSAAEVGGNSAGLTAPVWMRIRADDTTIYFDYAEQSAQPSEGQWTNISSETWDMGTGITQDNYVYLEAYNTPGYGEVHIEYFSWESL